MKDEYYINDKERTINAQIFISNYIQLFKNQLESFKHKYEIVEYNLKNKKIKDEDEKLYIEFDVFGKYTFPQRN